MSTPDRERENEWKESNAHIFWGELAPTEHLVQIYESDEIVMDALEGFVGNGITAGNSVVIIATDGHLDALTQRMKIQGFNVEQLRATNQFIPIHAQEALGKFMVNGWPDGTKFSRWVKEIINLARGQQDRQVRAYGEMVAVLWAEGHSGATVQLEHLWNKFCETEGFCLFCAYPKSGFTQDANESIQHICTTHTKMIGGWQQSKTEVFYKSIA